MKETLVILTSLLILSCNNNDGDYTLYYESNQIHGKGEIINNKLEGEWIYWLESGEKWAQGKYIKGQKHGIWIEWNQIKDNKIAVLWSYRNDTLNGKTIYYKEDGSKESEGLFRKNRFYGTWINYRNNKKYYDNQLHDHKYKMLLEFNDIPMSSNLYERHYQYSSICLFILILSTLINLFLIWLLIRSRKNNNNIPPLTVEINKKRGNSA